MKRFSTPKITLPQNVDVLKRSRLYRLIDSYKRKSIIWVKSPAGFGKTTLISSYIKDRKFPHVWYQIDKEDNEISNFFYYMTLAVKKSAPRLKKPIPSLTPERLLDLNTFSKRYFEAIFNYLKTPFIIVFDNYQNIPFDSILHVAICQGLYRIPEGIKLIFISREQPPPTLASLNVNYKIEFIDTPDLNFKINETKKVIKLQFKKRLSAKIVQDIQDITNGWIAGLILILCQIKREHLDLKMFRSGSLSEIFDYLASEIFVKLDTPIQEFLLKTAFFSKMTIKMAKEITGNSQANTILSNLNYKNCFIDKHYDFRLFYQYHPLFKKFLLSTAKTKFSANEILQIQYKAAKLLYESGQIEDAAEIYFKINMWNDFSKLILAQAESLIKHNRAKIVQDWINKIPPKILENEPWLNYWMGVSIFSFNPSEAKKYFQNAYKIFEGRQNCRGQLLSCLFIVNSIINERKNLRLLDPWLMEIQHLLKENKNFSIEIEVNITLTMLIALLLYKPTQILDIPLYKWVERAETLIHRVTDINQYINICYILSIYFNFSANFAKCAFILDRLNSIYKNKQKNILPLTIVPVK